MTDEQEERSKWLRKHAWDYFAQHAQQRLTTLNFYLVLASSITAAAATTFKSDFDIPALRLASGVLLVLLSLLFWKLDLRNRQLIKSAEAALRHFELADQLDAVADWPPTLLFSIEHRDAARRTHGPRHWPQRWPFSYSEVFGVLFMSFGVIGSLLILLAVN